MKRIIDLLTLEEITLVPIKVDLDKDFDELTLKDLYTLFDVVKNKDVKVHNSLYVPAYVLDILIARIKKLG